MESDAVLQIQEIVSETQREKVSGMRKRRMCRNPIYVLQEGEWWAFERKTQHMQAHGVNGPPPQS